MTTLHYIHPTLLALAHTKAKSGPSHILHHSIFKGRSYTKPSFLVDTCTQTRQYMYMYLHGNTMSSPVELPGPFESTYPSHSRRKVSRISRTHYLLPTPLSVGMEWGHNVHFRMCLILEDVLHVCHILCCYYHAEGTLNVGTNVMGILWSICILAYTGICTVQVWSHLQHMQVSVELQLDFQRT